MPNVALAADKEYFPSEVHSLVFSRGCQRMQCHSAHAWMFELIAIHQGFERFFRTVQRWEFVKLNSEVRTVCFDSEDNKLVDIAISIFEQIQSFSNHALYVADGVCWLEEEYEILGECSPPLGVR